MKPADISTIPTAEQQQSALDLFLIFVGANVVATTFQVGASLASSFTIAVSMALIVAGSVIGAALVAALAPLGSRLGVPSIIATRPALGMRGAAIVAALLYASNFTITWPESHWSLDPRHSPRRCTMHRVRSGARRRPD